MSSTREIRRRIRSVKNISQITKAMQMVAATKMRRAQLQALNGRPYNQTLSQILEQFLKNGTDMVHPLMTQNDSDKSAILLITTDKSLCGALNTNLFREILKNQNDKKTIFYTIGNKGRNFVVKTDRHLQADFPNTEVVTLELARQIRKTLVADFLSGQFHDLTIYVSNFISTLRQEPIAVKILPIQVDNFLAFVQNQVNNKPGVSSEYLFEPNPQELLDYSLNHHLDVMLYQALLESKASEHSARMMAMQNATDNAQDLVSDLTLAYNQIRQASITTELLEITSAQAALE